MKLLKTLLTLGIVSLLLAAGTSVADTLDNSTSTGGVGITGGGTLAGSSTPYYMSGGRIINLGAAYNGGYTAGRISIGWPYLYYYGRGYYIGSGKSVVRASGLGLNSFTLTPSGVVIINTVSDHSSHIGGTRVVETLDRWVR